MLFFYDANNPKCINCEIYTYILPSIYSESGIEEVRKHVGVLNFSVKTNSRI